MCTKISLILVSERQKRGAKIIRSPSDDTMHVQYIRIPCYVYIGARAYLRMHSR